VVQLRVVLARRRNDNSRSKRMGGRRSSGPLMGQNGHLGWMLLQGRKKENELVNESWDRKGKRKRRLLGEIKREKGRVLC
jgi:hypothetical protein